MPAPIRHSADPSFVVVLVGVLGVSWCGLVWKLRGGHAKTMSGQSLLFENTAGHVMSARGIAAWLCKMCPVL